jgi:hypothetical protein
MSEAVSVKDFIEGTKKHPGEGGSDPPLPLNTALV